MESGRALSGKQQIQTWANLRLKRIYWKTTGKVTELSRKQNSQLSERSGTRVAPGSRQQELAASLGSSVGVALLHRNHFCPWIILLQIQTPGRKGEGPISMN